MSTRPIRAMQTNISHHLKHQRTEITHQPKANNNLYLYIHDNEQDKLYLHASILMLLITCDIHVNGYTLYSIYINILIVTLLDEAQNPHELRTGIV